MRQRKEATPAKTRDTRREPGEEVTKMQGKGWGCELNEKKKGVYR